MARIPQPERQPLQRGQSQLRSPQMPTIPEGPMPPEARGTQQELQAMADVGRNLQKTAQTFWNVEKNTNVSEARQMIQAQTRDALIEIEQMNDPEQIREFKTKKAQQINNETDSRWGNRAGGSEISLLLEKRIGDFEAQARRHEYKTIADRRLAAGMEEYEQFIREGDEDGVINAIDGMYSDAVISNDRARVLEQQGREMIQYHQYWEGIRGIGTAIDLDVLTKGDLQEVKKEQLQELEKTGEGASYPLLSPDNREKLRRSTETFFQGKSKEIDHRYQQVRNNREAWLTEQLELEDYDANELLDYIESWENHPFNPMSRKESVQWRKKIREGEKEEYAENVRMRLNSLHFDLITDVEGTIDLDEFRSEVMELVPDVPMSEANKLLSLARKMTSTRKSRESTLKQETSDIERIAADEIQRRKKLGMFGNRVIEDGKDVTDKDRREKLEKIHRDTRRRVAWPTPFGPLPWRKLTEEEKNEMIVEETRELEEKWKREDKYYNRYQEAVYGHIEEKGLTGDDKEELLDFMSNLQDKIFVDEQFMDATNHIFGEDWETVPNFYLEEDEEERERRPDEDLMERSATGEWRYRWQRFRGHF